MGTTGQNICLWTAPVVGACWLICFLTVPGFTAPLSPTLPAEAVAAFSADPDNLDRTRYGMILFNWFGIAGAARSNAGNDQHARPAGELMVSRTLRQLRACRPT